jgi:flagellar biosynthetic protein FliS
MSLYQKRGAQQYGKVAVGSEVNFASPHRLVQMLMEGALEKIAIAKGHMARREYEAKGKHINWAISIINGLRGSLKDGLLSSLRRQAVGGLLAAGLLDHSHLHIAQQLDRLGGGGLVAGDHHHRRVKMATDRSV